MTKRVQLRRTKGWRKPNNTVVVARPTRWGNPFVVRRPRLVNAKWTVTGPGIELPSERFRHERAARQRAVDLFALHLGPMGLIEPDDIDEFLAPLRGKDLACWCPLDQPCHADVLLGLAGG